MSLTITNEFRIEEDALGDVQVPADHLLGCADAALAWEFSNWR